MGVSSTLGWESLEQRSATAFLLAGGLWAIDTAVNLLELILGISVPGVVFLVFILSSLLMTVVGVLGLYSGLADKGSRLGTAGVVFVGIAGITILVVLAWGIIANLVNQPLPPGGLAAVIVLLLVVGMLLFGIASLRAAVPSQTVGLLILVLVATWVVWLAGIAGLLGGNPEWSSAAFGAVLTVITLAIGYRLHTGGIQPARTASDAEMG